MNIIFLFQNETDVHVEIAFVRNKELTKLTVRIRNGIVTILCDYTGWICVTLRRFVVSTSSDFRR